MRKTLSLLTAALVVTGLAACSSSSPEPSATPTAAAASCENVKAGDASKSVKVEGAFRKTPTVSIPWPLKTSDVERSVVITGTGEKAKAGSAVDVAVAAYNGTTGKELIPAIGFEPNSAQTVMLDDSKYLPGIVRAVECLPIGSRVVLTAPAKDALGNADVSQLSLSAKDPVVLVADLVAAAATKADGAAVEPPAGFPTVTLAKSGEPTITIPKTDPPTETKIAVLKQGDGDTVQSGDTVTVQYKGVLWRNGQMFDSSWSRGEPASFATTGVVKGFQKALEGQKVGSQVIAVIPPADGYGDKGSGEIKATDTMVFVIDILKTAR